MSLIDDLRARVPEMLDALALLVGTESPSSDPAAGAACAEVAAGLVEGALGHKAERIEVDGRNHLRWIFGGSPRAVIVGHIDTVWPLGTLERWPFEVEGDNATGPGCFDMKGGVVQALFALQSLDSLDGIALVLTTDEELGSPTSRGLIGETVRGAEAVLVAEPSAEGSLKTSRKGVSAYRVTITGRAAHAGLDPEKGINAAVELAHQVLAIGELADPTAATTVTPSVITAGTTSNTVPGRALLDVDVRAFTAEEQERVDASIRSLTPHLDGVAISVERVATTSPLERSSSADLYARAQRVAEDLGLPALSEKSVGGGSDGNFTAGLGIPTLDGLGAVGGNAHAEGEWISVAAMPERAALLAALLGDLMG